MFKSFRFYPLSYLHKYNYYVRHLEIFKLLLFIFMFLRKPKKGLVAICLVSLEKCCHDPFSLCAYNKQYNIQLLIGNRNVFCLTNSLLSTSTPLLLRSWTGFVGFLSFTQLSLLNKHRVNGGCIIGPHFLTLSTYTLETPFL